MKLVNKLELERCPYCEVHRPHLAMQQGVETVAHSGGYKRIWRFYACASCGGVVTAAALHGSQEVVDYFPRSQSADETIPERARAFLNQAIESLHAPAGAMMLCASSVDAMLKEKGYKSGTLYSRIGDAVKDHLITEEMSLWAHEVRLGANEQRHPDEEPKLPSSQDAQRCIDFVRALGDFMFVLPARVARGRKSNQ